MKINEKCPCGGEVEIVYTTTGLRLERETERADGLAQLDVWRSAHKPCLEPLTKDAVAARLSDELGQRVRSLAQA